ncbi:thiol oxidoreductase [Halosquirtibacter laminarini]|uniref:Thiol oxidoreductase n=1 Tax=Halosquirtibacter laminarini TaxID=3374600 RepID=A0AC61NEV6_9BACT|nr:thiol oxidoreductase [Prolixibacteraceae bacterium]
MLRKFILMIVVGTLFLSCERDSSKDVTKPDINHKVKMASPRELSAGVSTIFTATSYAYDQNADWVTGKLYDRFLNGDALYDDPRDTSTNPKTGGRGPLFCGTSCGSCHNNSGRTKSSLITDAGTGPGDFSSFLTFIRTPNDQYHRNYGRVLHDHAIYGVKPEGKVHVKYTEEPHTLPDGTKYSLRVPKYWITDFYMEDIDMSQVEMTVRTPLRHVGMGQIMALDLDEIKALEKKQYPEYGISGEINWVNERGKRRVGLTGHKAHHSDLTVELGFLSDMGITSHRYPLEISYGQPQCTEDHGIEISSEDMADVDLYLHCLGVPSRRNINSEMVQYGAKMFRKAKCHLCHVETLHTRPEGATLIDGTNLPWLGGQTIHPYSDFLVHDMGPKLGDDFSQYNASGDEWRTAPLWGGGLQKIVNTHTDYLHDGRARNVFEAIMWHGGEGDVSRQIFANMNANDRQALIAFVNSL